MHFSAASLADCGGVLFYPLLPPIALPDKLTSKDLRYGANLLGFSGPSF